MHSEHTDAKAAARPPEPMRVMPLIPSRQVLSHLSVQDRDMLNYILNNPINHIDDPIFADWRTAAMLFGDQAEQVVGMRPWSVASDAAAAETAGASIPDEWEPERIAFSKLNYARFRVNRILDSAAARPLTQEEAASLLTWHRRCERLRLDLIESNLPLVLAMAKRARLGNVDYAELISEGNLALLRSVDKFDCNRGFKFSTYACRAILKSFSRVAIRTGRYRGRFPTEFDPSFEKSDHAELRREGVESDCVGELRAILDSNRADLTDVERRVLDARFSLGASPAAEVTDGRTLEQVGVMIGVTKERVRQIQNKAMAKLRAALEESVLAA